VKNDILYLAESWTMTRTYRNIIESSEIWMWTPMQNISSKDKKNNNTEV